jgi:23S rRNA (cytosine1962-C5)-methyltransferase
MRNGEPCSHAGIRMTTEPKVWLKPAREKSLRRKHPWVFSGAIARVEGEPPPGATVDIVTDGGEFLARAAYSPSSQIRARVWSFRREPIDAEWVHARLARAIDSRRRLGLLDAGSACRLVFAESDGLPGLIVDRYGDYLVCQFLAAGADARREDVVAGLAKLCSPRGILERSEGSARNKEGLKSERRLLVGSAPPPDLEIDAHGVRYLVDLAGGQKTGAYLDQQRNRKRVAAFARDGDVLDAFAYTGGFAFACLRAGAREATLIDSSSEALDLAARDAARNGIAERCRFVVANVFEELRALKQAGRQFDVVVLDPPKFVHSADQVMAGSRGYKDINLLGLQLVRPGGVLVTFSCSGHVDAALFQKIVAGAAVDSGRDAQILERLSQPADHPVATPFPEADYLKGLVLRVH